MCIYSKVTYKCVHSDVRLPEDPGKRCVHFANTKPKLICWDSWNYPNDLKRSEVVAHHDRFCDRPNCCKDTLMSYKNDLRWMEKEYVAAGIEYFTLDTTLGMYYELTHEDQEAIVQALDPNKAPIDLLSVLDHAWSVVESLHTIPKLVSANSELVKPSLESINLSRTFVKGRIAAFTRAVINLKDKIRNHSEQYGPPEDSNSGNAMLQKAYMAEHAAYWASRLPEVKYKRRRGWTVRDICEDFWDGTSLSGCFDHPSYCR